MDNMNSFFGHSVVEKLKFVSFDDDQNILLKSDNKKKNVTIKKYENSINNIKNDKLKKSLIEFARVFRQK